MCLRPEGINHQYDAYITCKSDARMKYSRP